MVFQSFLYSLAVMVSSVKVTVAWLIHNLLPPSLLGCIKELQK